MTKVLTFLLLLPLSLAISLTDRTIKMSTYSVRVPNSWYVRPDATNESVFACNEKRPVCTTQGGFPLPGFVTVTIIPTESTPGHPSIRNLEDVVAVNWKIAPSTESDVTLSEEATQRGLKSVVNRSLWPGDVWTEVYGLQIDSRLFRASVQYNNEPKKIESYRKAIVEILSSVQVQK